MLLNAQQLALEILSNMCCPDGKIAVKVVLKKTFYSTHTLHFGSSILWQDIAKDF